MRTCVVVLASISVLSGCATLKNTPQQDDVWEMGRVCDSKVAFWKIEEVKADGGYMGALSGVTP